VATTPIQRRVARLEESAGSGECSRCGWGGGDDFGPNDTYELTWIDPGGAEDREEFCEACGRQLVYVLTWGDEK
jgi:hypothetical protein